MPGRVFMRTSTTSGVTHKSSTQTLASRRSTASRNSSPTVVIPDEGPSSSLRAQICNLFGDAQRTTASHRKLVISLRKVQEACCYEPINLSNKSQEEFGEDDFNVEVARCVIRFMCVKKSEGVGDKLVRFLGLFLRHACEKDAALLPEELDETQSFPETPSTRLTSHILAILLPLLASKEKTVRYRSTQLIAHIINSLESIDDEYYHLLKVGLLKRTKDKEPMIRVQAVLGLGRLAGSEDEEGQDNADSDDDQASGLSERLLEILQHDPSADVRHSLLLNLPLTPSTLPYLLERARDVDLATRRALYSRLLPALGDFRHLSLSMREKLLRWGLRDRDENVRKATARLFRERWIEDCAGPQTADDGRPPGEATPPSVDGLLELLERIDVVNSAVEHGVAGKAMKEFWIGRPDYLDAMSFENAFWDNLTPESVFLARSFNDFCRQGGEPKLELLAEEKMPEVTKLAFFLQRYMNNLVDCLKRNDANGSGEGEDEDTVELEFVVEQLLHIAKSLDYSDEVGRRKMFSFMREALAIAELPDEITKLAVDVLRDVCGADAAGEREFCGVVLEAVAEVHDTMSNEEENANDEDESFHSAQSEMSGTTPTKASNKHNGVRANSVNGEEDEAKAIKEIMINMKCLHIAQCMLQNVEDNLQRNIHLVTMLNNLVVPAVRSHEAPIRERGLLCLGLCCLLDKNLAEENLSLFLHCFNKGHDALQVTALHILSDMLTTHPSLLSSPTADPALQKSVFKVFTKATKAVQSPDVQSAATTALCKLMLTSVVQDEELLKQLVVCYFDPTTKDNAGVRQALSYFLPVYCHSRRENMERMAAVVVGIMHTLVNLGEELEEDEEMVGIAVIGSILVDWTDARKLVVQDEATVSWDEAGRKEVKAVNGDVHLSLVEDLLEKAMSHGCTKEEKKALLSMLSKLYITGNSNAEKLQSAHKLVIEAIDLKIGTDATTRNALNKLEAALNKVLGESSAFRGGTEGETIAESAQEGLTVVDGGQIDLPGVPSNEVDDMKMDVTNYEVEDMKGTNDTLLEELLDDDEDEEA